MKAGADTVDPQEATPYYNYQFLHSPAKQLEEILIVSDMLAYMSSKELHLNRKFFNNNIVMYIVKGTFHVLQYGREYILHQGQGVLMKLTDPHEYYSDREDPAHLIFFHFRSETITPLMNALSLHKALPLLFEDPAVKDGIYRCFEITKNHRPDFEFELSGEINRILMRITAEPLMKMQHFRHNEDTWFVDFIHRYIEEHMSERIIVEDISHSLNMNKFYFNKKFKRIFGTSPLQYILLTKISRSIEMMRSPSVSITKVACAFGFFDEAHFSKAFRAHTGLPPYEYRRVHILNAPAEQPA